jgi:putative transcriptional regulator
MNTSVNHHPDSRLLNEFVAATLPLAHSACVSLHLNFCEHCRRQTQRLQQVGGSMFERLAPQPVDSSLLDSVMARLDDDAPLTYPRAAASSGDEAPALLQRLMKGDYEDMNWSRVNSQLQISRLRTGDVDNEFALYHIKAGGRMPKHTHRGTELTMVLEGRFSDEEGLYQQGDFILRDAHDVHTPTAALTGDCICVGVLDAPVRFTPWNYRVLNPFLKIQAH